MTRKIILILLIMAAAVPVAIFAIHIIAIGGILAYSSLKAAKSSPSPAAETISAQGAGAIYTVAKGDTPMAIAKKLHVDYDDLLKINKITDPRKLQVGQKLRVPAVKEPTNVSFVPATPGHFPQHVS